MSTLNPGDYVIMDNLSSHTGGSVVELLEACGSKVLYLPMRMQKIDLFHIAICLNLFSKCSGHEESFFSGQEKSQFHVTYGEIIDACQTIFL